MPSNRPELRLPNATLRFKNFAGRERTYNPEGTRNFSVEIPDEMLANQLATDGWNIKTYVPKTDPDAPIVRTLPVAVNYGNFPPRIYLICDGVKTLLEEKDLYQLDTAEISNADVVVSGYVYDVGGRKGIKAYLQKAYITIEVDEFDRKYAELDFPGKDDDVPF